jgi:hypothetical protein
MYVNKALNKTEKHRFKQYTITDVLYKNCIDGNYGFVNHWLEQSSQNDIYYYLDLAVKNEQYILVRYLVNIGYKYVDDYDKWYKPYIPKLKEEKLKTFKTMYMYNKIHDIDKYNDISCLLIELESNIDITEDESLSMREYDKLYYKMRDSRKFRSDISDYQAKKIWLLRRALENTNDILLDLKKLTYNVWQFVG